MNEPVPPFRPGDRVELTEEFAHKRGLRGLLYVTECRPFWMEDWGVWVVKLAGKPGERKTTGGYYHACFFKLVCRKWEPDSEKKRG